MSEKANESRHPLDPIARTVHRSREPQTSAADGASEKNEAPGDRLKQKGDIQKRLQLLKQEPQPKRLSLMVMAARLQDLERFKMEMLNDEFSDLLNRLWRICQDTVTTHGGIVGPYTGHCFQSFFLGAGTQSSEEAGPFQVVNCALDLKARLVELGLEWKARKNWSHDIMLNMGLHGGEEFVGILPSPMGDSLFNCGDMLQITAALSKAALGGRVLATKELLNRFPLDELKKLHFGVFRRENLRSVFIAKSFLRLGELAALDEQADLIPEPYRAIPVTELFDRKAS